MRNVASCFAMLCVPLVSACAENRATAEWSGTTDTLPSGQIVVRNPARPVWGPDSGWQAFEELRIGRVEGDGADAFARIWSFDVDAAGHVWILEAQAQELRVFSASGEHVRTIGRRGGGPGEFAQAVKLDIAPHGNIWVMDPRNARVSVFDTAGAFLESKLAAGGFLILPWPGGFDDRGRYYAPAPDRRAAEFRQGLVRFDSAFVPIDTLAIPEDPVTRESFVIRDDAGRARVTASVPYQGGLRWLFSPAGTIWALISDQYRLFELTPQGDTLRTITREFEPLPVTAEDLEGVAEDMEWFTKQGGRIDQSKIPSTKPPVIGFFQDDERNIWVERTTRAEAGSLFDVINAEGRYLGEVHLPFTLSLTPVPILRNGVLHGVTHDELEVPYIVRARIIKP